MNNLISKTGSHQRRNIISVLALLAFILVNAGDVHVRLCLDGQDPAVTSHFENLTGHSEHPEKGVEDNDLEYEVSFQLLKIKTLEITKVYWAISNFEIQKADSISQTSIFSDVKALLPQKPEYLSLPLRAPPLFS